MHLVAALVTATPRQLRHSASLRRLLMFSLLLMWSAAPGSPGLLKAWLQRGILEARGGDVSRDVLIMTSITTSPFTYCNTT